MLHSAPRHPMLVLVFQKTNRIGLGIGTSCRLMLNIPRNNYRLFICHLKNYPCSKGWQGRSIMRPQGWLTFFTLKACCPLAFSLIFLLNGFLYGLVMEYRGLNADIGEIRLITIFPKRQTDNDGEDFVECSLEYVSLTDEHFSQDFNHGVEVIGSDGVWSHESAEVDLDAVLYPKPASFPYFECLKAWASPSSRQILDDLEGKRTSVISLKDPSKSWRYAWGDYIALSYVWGDYIALSYVWGDINCQRQTIIVDGKKITVRSNLEAGLRQLRDCVRVQQGFKVWIDALCINQDDAEERSIQVSRMKDIYAKSWHVVIWLGNEADGSNTALDAIKFLSHRYRKSSCKQHPDLIVECGGRIVAASWHTRLRMDVFFAFHQLFTRPYWSRMWILQEVAIGGPTTPILCGSKFVLWQELQDTIDFITANEPGFWLATDSILFSKSLESLDFFSMLKKLLARGSVGARDWCKREWLKFHDITNLQRDQQRPTSADTWHPLMLGRAAEAADNRDKIYGLLGLSGIGEKFNVRPDYNLSELQVFLEFAKSTILASRCLTILKFVNNPVGTIINPRHHDESRWHGWAERETISAGCTHTSQLPSWAPCWICPQLPPWDTSPFRAGTSIPATPIFRPDHKTVVLKGALLSAIANLSAFNPTESDSTYPLTSLSGSAFPRIYPNSRAALVRTLLADSTGTSTSTSTSTNTSTSTGMGTGSGSSTGSARQSSWSDANANAYDSDASALLTLDAWEPFRLTFGASNNGNTLVRFLGRNRELGVPGGRLGDFMRVKWWRGNADADADADGRKRDGQEWKRDKGKRRAALQDRARDVLKFRRLVVLREGWIGVAPAGSRRGDVVAVLAGAEMPVVLRRVGGEEECRGEEEEGGEDMGEERWKVIGLAYVHGIMNGEAVEMMRKGKYQERDFVVC
jgi:hypothetical protein